MSDIQITAGTPEIAAIAHDIAHQTANEYHVVSSHESWLLSVSTPRILSCITQASRTISPRA